jgi:hypothetical protein
MHDDVDAAILVSAFWSGIRDQWSHATETRNDELPLRKSMPRDQLVVD